MVIGTFNYHPKYPKFDPSHTEHYAGHSFHFVVLNVYFHLWRNKRFCREKYI